LRFSNLSGSLSRSGKTNFINFQTQIPNSYEKSAQKYYSCLLCCVCSSYSIGHLRLLSFKIGLQYRSAKSDGHYSVNDINSPDYRFDTGYAGLVSSFYKKWVLLKDRNLRIKKYQTASFIRLTIIGVGLVLGMIFFYIMNSQSMLFCAGIAAIALFFCKPSEVKMVSELNLDELAD